MPSGLIVSESAPSKDNRYYWFKPSTREWYMLNDAATEWLEVFDEESCTLTNLVLEGTLSMGGDTGVSGQVELAGFGGGKVKLTITGGVITEIEEE